MLANNKSIKIIMESQPYNGIVRKSVDLWKEFELLIDNMSGLVIGGGVKKNPELWLILLKMLSSDDDLRGKREKLIRYWFKSLITDGSE